MNVYPHEACLRGKRAKFSSERKEPKIYIVSNAKVE